MKTMKTMFREEVKRMGLDKDVKALIRVLPRSILDDAPRTKKDVAKQAGASGAVNAVLEGVLVGLTCKEYVEEGVMSGRDAAKKVVIGASSGFVTASAGTAVTYGVAKFLGGPLSIAAGMAASASTRYAYSALLAKMGVEDLDAWMQGDHSSPKVEESAQAHTDDDDDDEDDEDEE